MTHAVTNCLDGNSAGTLRAAIAAAASGDTIDLTGLACSTITLTQGELGISQDALTIVGPVATAPLVGPALTIDAAHGSRVFNASGDLTIQSLALKNGTVTVADGRAGGGCVFAYENLVLSGSTVSGCSATGAYASGGGVYSYYGSVAVTDSVVSGNTATATTSAAGTSYYAISQGAGVYSFLTLSVTRSTISDNVATLGTVANGAYAQSIGGGIRVAGYQRANPFSDSIVDSTISGNSAQYGAGAYVAGNVTVSNSTISGNSADAAGGGFMSAGATTLILQNSTIAFNTSPVGGGAFIASGAKTTINSTIIFGNTQSSSTIFDLQASAAATVAGNNNLISTSQMVTFANAPLTTDPLLQPLADNGGPTLTHALGAGSPALEAGNNVANLTNDQRGTGFPRTVGVTDIGAYEASTAVTDRIFQNGFE